MADYINVVYDISEKPKTDYPARLVNYLAQRYSITAGKKLLEIGCGRGDFLSEFSKICYARGVDRSGSAKNLSPDLEIITCDLEKEEMPFEDDSFDFVYSKSVIEHFGDPECYMKQVKRVLKPGGTLITLCPDWESNMQIYFDDHTHKTPFTLYAINDLYKIYDMKEIAVEKFIQLPAVWKYPALKYLCKIIAAAFPHRMNNKFIRFSKELMILASGKK